MLAWRHAGRLFRRAPPPGAARELCAAPQGLQLRAALTELSPLATSGPAQTAVAALREATQGASARAQAQRLAEACEAVSAAGAREEAADVAWTAVCGLEAAADDLERDLLPRSLAALAAVAVDSPAAGSEERLSRAARVLTLGRRLGGAHASAVSRAAVEACTATASAEPSAAARARALEVGAEAAGLLADAGSEARASLALRWACGDWRGAAAAALRLEAAGGRFEPRLVEPLLDGLVRAQRWPALLELARGALTEPVLLACARHKRHSAALRMWRSSERGTGTPLARGTLYRLLRCALNMRSTFNTVRVLDAIRAQHGPLTRDEFHSALMVFAQAGMSKKAVALLDEWRGRAPLGGREMTVALRACAEAGDVPRARALWARYEADLLAPVGAAPHASAVAAMARALFRGGLRGEAEALLAGMAARPNRPTLEVRMEMEASAAGRAALLQSAKAEFGVDPGQHMHALVIEAALEEGDTEAVVRQLEAMLASGVRASASAFVAAMKACANDGNDRQLVNVYASALERGAFQSSRGGVARRGGHVAINASFSTPVVVRAQVLMELDGLLDVVESSSGDGGFSFEVRIADGKSVPERVADQVAAKAATVVDILREYGVPGAEYVDGRVLVGEETLRELVNERRYRREASILRGTLLVQFGAMGATLAALPFLG